MKPKSQIDVALVIGSIIVPLVALLAGIIFAWSTLSQFLDVSLLFYRISYEVVNLASLGYTVPDNIIFYYFPAPEYCTYSGGSYQCADKTLIIDPKGIINGIHLESGNLYFKRDCNGCNPDSFDECCKKYEVTTGLINGMNFPLYIYSGFTGTFYDPEDPSHIVTLGPFKIKSHANFFDLEDPYITYNKSTGIIALEKVHGIHDKLSGNDYDFLEKVNELRTYCSACSTDSSTFDVKGLPPDSVYVIENGYLHVYTIYQIPHRDIYHPSNFETPNILLYELYSINLSKLCNGFTFTDGAGSFLEVDCSNKKLSASFNKNSKGDIMLLTRYYAALVVEKVKNCKSGEAYTIYTGIMYRLDNNGKLYPKLNENTIKLSNSNLCDELISFSSSEVEYYEHLGDYLKYEDEQWFFGGGSSPSEEGSVINVHCNYHMVYLS